MRKLLLLTLLCFSINGFAFNWKKVANDVSGNSYYVDVDNIKKHNGLVYYWWLLEYLEPNTAGELSANSSINKYKVDCGEEKQTLLSNTFYSQSMGKGKNIGEITPNRIEYTKPNTVAHILMKFACNNAK